MSQRRGFLCWLLGCKWRENPRPFALLMGDWFVKCERCGRTDND